jgi:hypothetical protein
MSDDDARPDGTGADDPSTDPESATEIVPGFEESDTEAGLDAAETAVLPRETVVEPVDKFEYSDGTRDTGPAITAEQTEDDGSRWDAPPLPPTVAVVVAGILCGFLTVGFVWLSERGCDASRGTPSCGALGLPLLILTVVVTIVAGAYMLRRLMQPNPVLVAFLGVTFMLLIVVGLLADRLFTPWSLLVVPALTAATFLVARFVAGKLEA